MKPDVPFEQFGAKEAPSFDMNEVAGKKDILFICLDTLRYDAAKEEEEKGNTPVLNQYGPWQKCQAPGNFTYPSHHAMFAGFLPCPWAVSYTHLIICFWMLLSCAKYIIKDVHI